jgi:hypothetical protein
MLSFFGKRKIKRIETKLIEAVIIYVVFNPSKSPSTPIINRATALRTKFIVIKTPFINPACSDFIMLTSASNTGVVANIITPISISKGMANIVWLIYTKRINKNGVVVAIINRVRRLPILSEIVPEKSVPAAPAN